MKFQRTRIDGAWLLDLERRGDERGFFARTYCAEEFAAHGMQTAFPQMNTNFSALRGTLRGLHYQKGADAEAKLVRCIAGRAFEMVLDLRPQSPTYKQWQSFTLDPVERRLLYLPPGCAHGFLALEDNTEITYLVSRPYAPGTEGGVRFDDPAFGFEWPMPITTVSDKDRAWPNFAG
jgi:dTDP-4-dehydrorhamnose 3,5-epimerase